MNPALIINPDVGNSGTADRFFSHEKMQVASKQKISVLSFIYWSRFVDDVSVFDFCRFNILHDREAPKRTPDQSVWASLFPDN